jgi:UDP-glucuronate 4-epimerase
VVEGLLRVLDQKSSLLGKQSASTNAVTYAPYRVFNIGHHQPVQLLDFIEAIEAALGKSATKNFLPMQEGDVVSTFADSTALQNAVGYSPSTPVNVGIAEFVRWFLQYRSMAG